jgi:hypothetical protein
MRHAAWRRTSPSCRNCCGGTAEASGQFRDVTAEHIGERLVITGYGTRDGNAPLSGKRSTDRSTTSSGEFVIAGGFLRRSTSARRISEDGR